MLAASTASSTSAAQALQRPPGYVLAWADEFDHPGLPDARRWTHDTSRNRAGWYNEELQYYARDRAENARVEKGRLIISARHEDLADARPRDWGGQAFSSARLTTRGKAKWRGGFFEVRAKMPCVLGAWPAIWLLPDSHRGDWEGGEIDIAEHVGFRPDTVYHAVHTRERNFRRGNHLQTSTQLDACGAFHTYQLLWTDEQIVIGVDGEASLSAPAASFERPMSLILNVAVGGTWGGERGIDAAAFPARMEVDYVRVWQPLEGQR
ncbi:glycoside hydrolase family 16 protein [Tsuneonella sp. HG222]